MTLEQHRILTSTLFSLQQIYPDFPEGIWDWIRRASFKFEDEIDFDPDPVYYFVNTIPDLIRFSRTDLLRLYGIGKKRINDIEKWLNKHGLMLNPEDQLESCHRVEPEEDFVPGVQYLIELKHGTPHELFRLNRRWRVWHIKTRKEDTNMMHIIDANAVPIDPTKEPVPEGMKVATCAKCGAHFVVPGDADYASDCLCGYCATLPESEGSKEAAAAVAAALGQ